VDFEHTLTAAERKGSDLKGFTLGTTYSFQVLLPGNHDPIPVLTVLYVPSGSSVVGRGEQLVWHQHFTTKSKVVVQSILLTIGTNHFTRGLPPGGSRDPLRVAEGGALSYARR